jgi:hypothetical protein
MKIKFKITMILIIIYFNNLKNNIFYLSLKYYIYLFKIYYILKFIGLY